jgi:hypothetical protein
MEIDNNIKRKYLSEKDKKTILTNQEYKCANSIINPALNLKDYQCLLWLIQDGYFDKAGYQFDHINELCLTNNNSLDNYQALCPNCHAVKTNKFRKNKNIFTSEELDNGCGIMEVENSNKKRKKIN